MKTKEELFELISSKETGQFIPARCKESFLKRIDYLNFLEEETKLFGRESSIKEKLVFLETKENRCRVCGIVTKLNNSDTRSFNPYCSSKCYRKTEEAKAILDHHNEHQRKGIIITKELLEEYYINQKLNALQISKLIGLSNVTISKYLKKFGIEQRPLSEIQSLNSPTKGTSQFLFDKEWWEKEYSTKSSSVIAMELNCSTSLVLQRLEFYGIPRDNHVKSTKEETLIFNFLQEQNVEFEKKNTSILYPKELDIYIPSKNLAIEVNGVYWHSEKMGRDKHYHLNKTKMCQEKGIQLLHFWDFEINDNLEIVKSMISSKLGNNERIFARHCSLVEIENDISKKFFQETHLQGFANSSFSLGLMFQNELVCCASFSKPRFNPSFDLELIRFSSKKGITVVGGLSKILSKIKSKSLISYANRRWSNGGVYKSCGFSLSYVSEPAYFYTKDFLTIESRFKFQKHKLTKMNTYSLDLSEDQIMKNEGYYKIWDCGNLVFIK